MLRAILFATIGLADIVFVGWCGVMAGSGWRGSNGEAAALLSLCESVLQTGVASGVWLFVAFLASLLLARLQSATMGLFGLGVGMVCFAATTGTHGSFIRQGGGFIGLIVEALVWGVVLLALVWVSEQTARGPRRASNERTGVLRMVLRGVPIVLPMLGLLWLVSRSEMKGQTITAVVVAAMVGGLLHGLFAHGSRLALVYSLPMVTAIIGYSLVGWRHGAVGVAEMGSGWTSLALPMPQDFAGGGLVGIAIGTAWAKTFLQEGPGSATRHEALEHPE